MELPLIALHVDSQQILQMLITLLASYTTFLEEVLPIGVKIQMKILITALVLVLFQNGMESRDITFIANNAMTSTTTTLMYAQTVLSTSALIAKRKKTL